MMISKRAFTLLKLSIPLGIPIALAEEFPLSPAATYCPNDDSPPLVKPVYRDSADFIPPVPALSSQSLRLKQQQAEPRLPNYPWQAKRRGTQATAVNDISYPQQQQDFASDFTQSLPMEPESPQDLSDMLEEESLSDDASTDITEAATAQELSSTAAHSPVLYRFFGRSRVRARTLDSVPFILIGPSVDHWTSTGQSLASRGFSVIACERVLDKDSKIDDPEAEAKNLVLAVLDALKWNRAILVGCDQESALAIQAALELAPERIAGLVLCGDLQSAERLVKNEVHGPLAIDSYLQAALACPYTIVYDGDWHSRSQLSASMDLKLNRVMIIGGGSAPHRRQPEQFAWTLTRFVEEKVVPVTVKYASKPQSNEGEKSRLSLPFGLGDFSGSFLVAGRTIARFLIYGSLLKVAIYQYDNFHGGFVSLQSHYRLVRSSPKKALAAISSFFSSFSFASLSRLFQSTNETEAFDDDDIEKDVIASTDEPIGTHNDSLPCGDDDDDDDGGDNDSSATEKDDADNDDSDPQDEPQREFPSGLMFLDQTYV